MVVADEDGDGGANRLLCQANLYQIDRAEEHDTSGIAARIDVTRLDLSRMHREHEASHAR